MIIWKEGEKIGEKLWFLKSSELTIDNLDLVGKIREKLWFESLHKCCSNKYINYFYFVSLAGQSPTKWCNNKSINYVYFVSIDGRKNEC